MCRQTVRNAVWCFDTCETFLVHGSELDHSKSVPLLNHI